MIENKDDKIILTSAEIALVKYIRNLKFGKITVQVVNSRPVSIDQSFRLEKVKFDN